MIRKIAPAAVVAIVIALSMHIPLLAKAGPPDDIPCGEPFPHTGIQRLVQTCALWRGHVPVYESNGPGFFGGANSVVGYLDAPDGNWFVCQEPGDTYTIPGTSATNDFWAQTLADNGRWGWVPEAYFAGGGNFVPDAGLARC